MDRPYYPLTGLRSAEQPLSPFTEQQISDPAPMPSFEQAKTANEQAADREATGSV